MKNKIITVLALNALVMTEAKRLKKNATEAEINKLSFEDLDSSKSHNCIYGQMAGYCFNDRATELIEASCTKVLERVILPKHKDMMAPPILGKLNGSPKKTHRDNYWSPIEMFIDLERNKKNGNNQRLIAYLKGETEMLKLK